MIGHAEGWRKRSYLSKYAFIFYGLDTRQSVIKSIYDRPSHMRHLGAYI